MPPRGSAFRETQTSDFTLRAIQKDLRDTLTQLEDHRRGLVISDVRVVTTNADLGEDLVVVYVGPGAHKLRLPPASLRGSGRGQVLQVVNTGGAAITLTPSGRDILNGAAASLTLAKNGAATLVSDGNTAWFAGRGPNAGAGAGTKGSTSNVIQALVLDEYGAVTSVTSSGTPDVFRWLATKGTAPVAADFALSAGWGSTAAVAVTAGSRDSRGRITVTSAGVGQAANPTITFTYKDGLYASAPFAIVKRNGGTGATTEPTWTTATGQTVITWPATPVAGLTYVFEYLVQG
ncbi:MAG: hypothetical protein LC640_09170 [Frankia sp.]|nr:hypothetical protein [Frankia sp.]